MRIRCGFTDGVQDIVIGELEATPTGIKTYGAHKRWLRNIIKNYRHIPVSQAAAYGQIGVTVADLTPKRLIGRPPWLLRLTDEQLLLNVLDYCRNSAYNWAEEV